MHWDVQGSYQFITWRLADSLPEEVVARYNEERLSEDEIVRRSAFKQIDVSLDKCHGECPLKHPLAAREVLESLKRHAGNHYDLCAFVVMPNHVHVILHTIPGTALKDIMRLVKGGSAHGINAAFNRHGRVWQPDYFDRLIRDPQQLEQTRHYIHWNPVKAKLCVAPEHYPFSSANPRFHEIVAGWTEVQHPNAE